MNILPHHPSRKWFFNQAYFDVIDTEKKAYFLGLMYADGFVISSMQKSGITLHKDDVELLKAFAQDIGFKGPFYENYNGNKQKTCRTMTLSSYYTANSLTKQGCFPRKSFTLLFPNESQVPSRLLHHFIRGYFDGDGCASLSEFKKWKYMYFTFSLISSEMFCQGAQEALIRLVSLPTTKLLEKKNKSKGIFACTYRSVVGPNCYVYKLYDFLYKDATIFLKRKHDKFKLALSMSDEIKKDYHLISDVDGEQSYQMNEDFRKKKGKQWSQSIQGTMSKKGCSSKYVGVSKAGKSRFRCFIMQYGKFWIKEFDDELVAAEAYDKMALFLYGKNARRNFPEKLYTQEEIEKIYVFFETKRLKTSRYHHVDFVDDRGLWRALVKVNKKDKVKYFDNEVKAAEWVDAVRVVCTGQENMLNFPEKLIIYKQYTIEAIYKKSDRVSSFRGMYYDKGTGLWNAAFISKGISYECGKYKTRPEARDAILKKRKDVLDS